MTKKTTKVYGYFDDVPDKERLHTGSESRVQQHHAEACDMKQILNNFMRTGEVPLSSNKMQFIDATEATSYDESLQIVLDAQDTFAELPSKVRKKFNNDPRELLLFMDDPSNLEEARELGLAEPEPIPEPRYVGEPVHSLEINAGSPEGEQGGVIQTSVA